jgi:glycerate 2-kinase
VTDSTLRIMNEEADLSQYKRVFVIGFGKGSAGIAQIIEKALGDRLTDGYVIDNVEQSFSKIHFTQGTHPLPSETNIAFTKQVLDNIHDLTEEDLVLVVICGGGSAMFEAPYALEFEKLKAVFDSMLKSGANISEMNVIRKHLSKVKGGGLAKHLFPARVMSLMFSDVPGSVLSVIASGPTVKEESTMEDVQALLTKYPLPQELTLTESDFSTLASDDKYFEKVSNLLIVSNRTAMEAMKKKAEELGVPATIGSDKTQGNAKTLAEQLLTEAKPGLTLLGGETTLHVTGTGKGGRNQTLVLGSLAHLPENTTFASFDSDGMDFYFYAGAIADSNTVKKAAEMHLDPQSFLDDDNSYEFFAKIGDGIDTGKLESNVSDLMIIYKK